MLMFLDRSYGVDLTDVVQTGKLYSLRRCIVCGRETCGRSLVRGRETRAQQCDIRDRRVKCFSMHTMNRQQVTWDELNDRIEECRACGRLVEYCARVAREKRAAYLEWDYWGRPVANFGSAARGCWWWGSRRGAWRQPHGAGVHGRLVWRLVISCAVQSGICQSAAFDRSGRRVAVIGLCHHGDGALCSARQYAQPRGT